MENTIKRDVRNVIEEIDAAYQEFSNYNYMNADYADFANMAISQFRDAMRTPELTREELKDLIRKGMIKHRMRNHEDDNWTKSVASYMAKASNANNNSFA